MNTPRPEACRFCGHDVYHHNHAIGCQHCTCMGTPGEGRPRDDHELAQIVLPAGSFKLGYSARDNSGMNVVKALALVAEIDGLRAVQRELKSAFARSELDGGAKAALTHPLYLQIQKKLDEAHDALMILI